MMNCALVMIANGIPTVLPFLALIVFVAALNMVPRKVTPWLCATALALTTAVALYAADTTTPDPKPAPAPAPAPAPTPQLPVMYDCSNAYWFEWYCW